MYGNDFNGTSWRGILVMWHELNENKNKEYWKPWTVSLTIIVSYTDNHTHTAGMFHKFLITTTVFPLKTDQNRKNL